MKIRNEDPKQRLQERELSPILFVTVKSVKMKSFHCSCEFIYDCTNYLSKFGLLVDNFL